MALRWVKENIHNFGGDPDNITLFGQSSGSSSVHFHTISDYSKNLFHKAIMESGSSLNPWSIRRPDDFNERIARIFGWTDADDQDALMTTLLAADPAELASAQDICTVAEIQSGNSIAFVPVIEPYDNGNRFVSSDPSIMAKTAWFNKNPALIGSNSAEGYLFTGLFWSRANLFTDPDVYQNMLPPQIKSRVNSRQRISLGENLRQFYFGNDTLNANTIDKGALLIGDKIFWQGQSSAVRARLNAGNHAPTYLFRFDFDSDVLTFIKLFLAGSNVPGTLLRS